MTVKIASAGRTLWLTSSLRVPARVALAIASVRRRPSLRAVFALTVRVARSEQAREQPAVIAGRLRTLPRQFASVSRNEAALFDDPVPSPRQMRIVGMAPSLANPCQTVETAGTEPAFSNVRRFPSRKPFSAFAGRESGP